MAEELEDKYSRFKRNTGIDLQEEIATGVGEVDLDDYYTKVETDVFVDDLDERVTELEESTPEVDLSDTPRFLLYNAGWPLRGNSPRATFFIGGSPDTDVSEDINLAAGDLWVPFGGEMI